MGNREYAFEIFSVASLLEARGANPYRVRAYRRAAVRLLRMPEDVSTFLDERGELALPGLGQRLRRKLGELVRTGHLSFHDELIAAEPRPVRTLMRVPGIGPKTADRLMAESRVRGLRSLVRAARQHRLQRLHGVGPARERAWGEAAERLLAPESVGPSAPRGTSRAEPGVALDPSLVGAAHSGQASFQLPLFVPVPPDRALVLAADADPTVTRPAGSERAA